MKLDTLKKEVSVIRGDKAESNSYGIDAKNMHLAIQAFYQYSDPIGSIIREITSNGYDAHIEARVDKPVVVSINESEQSLNVIDFGVGLSPQRVDDIFTKFFSSTKRENNDEIGAFGLGSKSPLSYTDMFQVISKYGDTVYEYVIHKADGVPDLLKTAKHQWTPDTWPWERNENGTQVIIPFKESDQKEIIQSAKKQLCYFDSVVVDHPKFEDYNQEKILRADHFIYRQTDQTYYGINRLHMCVGKVYYQLESLKNKFDTQNFSQVMLWIEEEARKADINEPKKHPFISELLSSSSSGFSSPISQFFTNLEKLPMALYFDIGELPILWHRENIEYTEDAWETIFRRAIQAGIEMYEMQFEIIGPITSLADGIKAELAGSKDKDNLVYMSSRALDTTFMDIRLTDLAPHVGNRYQASPSVFLSNLYDVHEDSKSVKGLDLGEQLFASGGHSIYRIEKGESRKPYLKDYMKSQRLRELVLPRRNLNAITEKLQVDSQEGRKIVEKYYDEFIKAFEARIPEANNIPIPDSFNRKPTSHTKSEIPILWRRLGGSRNVQYRRDDLKVALEGRTEWGHMSKLPSMLIYGFQDDREKLNMYAVNRRSSLFRSKFGDGYGDSYKAIMGTISQDTAKFIHEVCPSYYIEDFLYHRRAVNNMVTNYLMHLYRQKYPWFDRMLDNKDICLSTFSDLESQKLISWGEYKRIKHVLNADPGYAYSETSDMYEYIMHGLKHRYYHWDELEELRWAHGMLAKYAPLMGSMWAHITKKQTEESKAALYYFEKDLQRIQQQINPTLYRKYHVKTIE